MFEALKATVDRNNNASRLRNETFSRVIESTQPIPLDLFVGSTPLTSLIGRDTQNNMDDCDYRVSPEVREITDAFDQFLEETFEGSDNPKNAKETVKSVVTTLAYPFGVGTGERIDATGAVTIDGVRTVVSRDPSLLEQIKWLEDPLKRDLIKKLFAVPTSVSSTD